MRSQVRARLLRTIYAIHDAPSDTALAEIAADLGLTVEISPDLTVAREIYFDDTVVLRANQSRAWHRWLLAHVIGHRLLHSGDQFVQHDRSRVARQENEANAFAFALLCPACAGDEPVEDWQMAERCEIPAECAAGQREAISVGGGGQSGI